MTNFRVIKEKTHKHKIDNLYILMFKSGDKFGVDVTDSNKGYGRIVVDTKNEAEYLLDMFSVIIEDTKDFKRSCDLCTSALIGSDFKDVVMFLHTNRNIRRQEIYALVNMLGFLKEEKLSAVGKRYIEIFEKGEAKPYGQFIPVGDGTYAFYYLSSEK